MSQPHTSGVWTVKAGREDAFIAAWAEMAEWTTRDVPGSLWGKLLRDHEHPTRFVSFGPWESLEAIAAWREDPGFTQRVGPIMEMLESFEASVLEVVAEAD